MRTPPPVERRWLSETRLLGFDGRPHRHRLGLRRLDDAAWLDPDDRAEAQLALKRELISTRRPDVVLESPTPDARRAVAELERRIRAAQGVAATPLADEGSAITRCGLATQEDWCVMMREDTWRLRAACVCFPSRWLLAEKAGATVAEIHEPVPGYRAQLDGLVERALDRLPAEEGVWRLNWNLWDDPRLFQPVEDPDAAHWPLPTGDEVGERVVLRIERQTMRRLDDDAVAFGIRIHQRPLASLLDQPGALERLAATLEGLRGSPVGTKKLGRLDRPVRDWVDAARC